MKANFPAIEPSLALFTLGAKERCDTMGGLTTPPGHQEIENITRTIIRWGLSFCTIYI